MAFAYLNDTTAIWKNLGLNYLLMPHDVEKEVAPARKEVVVQEKKAPAKPSTARPQAAMPRYNKENYSSLTKKEVSPTLEPKKAEPKKWNFIPPEQWPEVWRQHLQTARRGRFAWTYLNLGKDILEGRLKIADNNGERQKRSSFLMRLLKDLNHPAGTHTFWPIAMPENGQPSGELVLNPDLFWSGVKTLGCRGVIIMGGPAARAALGSENIKPLTQIQRPGFFIWILWDVDVMLTHLDRTYSQSVTFLRQSLKNFVQF